MLIKFILKKKRDIKFEVRFEGIYNVLLLMQLFYMLIDCKIWLGRVLMHLRRGEEKFKNVKSRTAMFLELENHISM